jgi:uncharacterized protein YndB with AHSA1/START domain
MNCPKRVDRSTRTISASPSRIYRALTNQEAIQTWLPPTGARGTVEVFEPRPGGAFRMTLIFDDPGETGRRKSSTNTDVVAGEFVELMPDRLVRQRFTFQSEDPAFAGAMLMTWVLVATPDGTEVSVAAEDVPEGISPRDHEVGMASSLANLAKYVERQK